MSCLNHLIFKIYTEILYTIFYKKILAVAFTMLAPKYLGNVGKYHATKNTEGKKVENRPLTTQEKRRCTAMFIMVAILFLMRNRLHHMMTDEDLELKDSANLNV
ncbi:hypothetical protein B2H94_06160 [Clostridium sporogenes]|uniref:Uncharacterized protein n=3 Tax=Clostridiaceae TaxID=31979 RepID=A0AAE6LUJ2_CLOSG|nr:hypothetical protein N495_08050 [Clostridium botulinum B2 450]MCW7998147.1 hypothetical protein [Clostridium sp. cpc1]OSB18691.1 hypothetical protein B2H94_06160 [Clostridium sporogenes]QDY32339.1 hypothetical protein CGS26_08250 [Clostridium sporogenes]